MTNNKRYRVVLDEGWTMLRTTDEAEAKRSFNEYVEKVKNPLSITARVDLRRGSKNLLTFVKQ